MRLLIHFVLGASFLLGAPRAKADEDLDRMQGDWVMQSSERDGQKLTAEQVKGFSRTVKGDSYTVTIESEEGVRELHGKIVLDPTKDPKAIDAKLADGPSKGQTMLGIYNFERDTQTVCFAPPGKKRPATFDSMQGTLTVWKRGKSAGATASPPDKGPDRSVEEASVNVLRRIVDECNRQSIAAFKKGDMLAVAHGYADDATIYFPSNRRVHGRQAIDRYWQQIKGPKDWTLRTIEVGGTKDAIYEVGKSSLITEVDGKESKYVCDYVVIWKPQKDGSYRAHTDIFN
jgi:uncharacterized protein (TIGR03067 family)